MRIRIWSGTCAAMAFGLTVGVLAQDTSQAQQTTASAKTITVTGCIQRAEQPSTTTTGTAASTRGMNETKFVLTNAASTTGTTATTGTTGTTPSTTAVASEYRLDADDAKLTPHVGHKVEISGTAEQPPRTTQPPAASAAKAPKLKVNTVKMISSTCP